MLSWNQTVRPKYLVISEAYLNKMFHFITSTTLLEKLNRIWHKIVRINQDELEDRDFIEHANLCYKWSLVTDISKNLRVIALRYATLLTILSPTGQERSRMLATLYQDKRSQQLFYFNILEKKHLNGLRKPDDLSDTMSREALINHMVDDIQALIELLILAASKLYNNFNYAGIDAMLYIMPVAVRVEQVASKMINDERVHGYIDKNKSTIHFCKFQQILQVNFTNILH